MRNDGSTGGAIASVPLSTRVWFLSVRMHNLSPHCRFDSAPCSVYACACYVMLHQTQLEALLWSDSNIACSAQQWITLTPMRRLATATVTEAYARICKNRSFNRQRSKCKLMGATLQISSVSNSLRVPQAAGLTEQGPCHMRNRRSQMGRTAVH
jgi:hypothetical protein